MKQTCTKCGDDKQVEEFNWRIKGVKRHPSCRECTKKAGKKHYQHNKQYYIDNVERNRAVLKEWYVDYKSTLSCELCPENRAPCLDFHHIDSSTKEMSVAMAVNNNWSLGKLKKEIDKCQVVCKNCHAIIHQNIRV